MRLSPSVVILLLGALAVSQSLRAAETVPVGKLPADATPTKYTLDLKIDPHAERFSGRARIHVRLDAATDHIWLHAKKLAVTHAQLIDAAGTSRRLSFAMRDPSGVAEIRIGATLPAQEVDLVLDYNAPFNPESEGLYKVRVGDDDYVISQMEAITARYAFPGFDEPRFKTPFEIRLTVPQKDLAFSNTREISEETTGDGKWKTVVFATTKPLPTYLIAFAVGPWDVAQGPVLQPNSVRANPVSLRGIGPRGTAPQLKWILDQVPAIVNYLEQYTAQPYAFDKLDLLGVPSFGAEGMENAGLIIFDDALLRFDANSPAGAYRDGYNTVAHEISHQWFGDLVTMPWWDDLWLNESFANWAQARITIALKPEYLGEMDRAEDALSAMGSDSLLTARKIRQPVNDDDDIENAFDSITYQKGAALLRMVETWVGEDNYRDALRKYLAQRAFGSGSTDDLIAAIAAGSGKGESLRNAMRSFLDQPGVPLVRAEFNCKDRAATMQLSQTRYLPYGAAGKDALRWVVPVCIGFGGTGTPATQCVVLTEPRQEFAVDGGCAEWYAPNAHANGYYRTSMDDRDFAALGKHFGELGPLDQKSYVDSIASSFRHGDLAPAALLDAMPMLAGSSYPQIAMGLIGWFKWIRDHLADDESRPLLDAFATRLYAPPMQALGFRHRAIDTLAAILLRIEIAEFLAQTLRDESVRSVLAEQGRAALGLGSASGVDLTRADPDLRKLALQVAVQDAGAPAFNVALAELKTNHETLQRYELLNALGASRDPKLAERARNFGLTPSLQVGEMLTIFSAQTAQAENRAAFWLWFKNHFETIRARLPDEEGVVGLVSVDQCSDAEAKQLSDWFTPRIKQLVGLERMLAQSLERIQQCSALRTHVGVDDLATWTRTQQSR